MGWRLTLYALGNPLLQPILVPSFACTARGRLIDPPKSGFKTKIGCHKCQVFGALQMEPCRIARIIGRANQTGTFRQTAVPAATISSPFVAIVQDYKDYVPELALAAPYGSA